MPVTATGIRGNTAGIARIGVLQGISIDGPATINGDGSFSRFLQVGISRENVEGNPATPSLKMDIPGMWRFRWSVKAGARAIQLNVKQAANGSPRPSMVVKLNTAVGLNADMTAVAGSSTGWVTIGPVSFTATGSGAVWVELHNNYFGATLTPCYWDHIVAV